jgi:Kef-type K+ transport system membrane component KefB
MDALFLGAMMAISSTTIIVKALDELNLKHHRFAQLIFGVLLVEDMIAIAIDCVTVRYCNQWCVKCRGGSYYTE